MVHVERASRRGDPLAHPCLNRRCSGRIPPYSLAFEASPYWSEIDAVSRRLPGLIAVAAALLAAALTAAPLSAGSTHACRACKAGLPLSPFPSPAANGNPIDP
ncbi:hypothetical protein ACFX58_04365 [Sphingomonas sp. NCPPB 2930]